MGYTVKFYNDNYKNCLNITIANKNIEKKHIYSGYIY